MDINSWYSRDHRRRRRRRRRHRHRRRHDTVLLMKCFLFVRYPCISILAFACWTWQEPRGKIIPICQVFPKLLPYKYVKWSRGTFVEQQLQAIRTFGLGSQGYVKSAQF